MVGFDPKSKAKLSSFEVGFAGIASGIVRRLCCQPLGVIKIRLQLQVDPIRATQGSKYHGMFQAGRLIVREEGVRALWKGHVPAQSLSAIYGLVQFATFETLTKWSWTYLPERITSDFQPVVNFACGSVAGILSATAALPMDVIRTRLVAQGEPRIYNGLFDAAKKMWSQEGFHSFYRGFTPAVIQTAPYIGFQFSFYVGSVRLWNSLIAHTNDEVSTKLAAFQSLVCGSLAGTSAKVVLYPFDFLRKRLQVIGFESARQNFGTVHSYNGFIDCVKVILKREGIRGMYKGLIPSLGLAGANSGIGFMTYEMVCRYFTYLHHS